MPYIFPKRRLKSSDVLDPNDLNQDFVPVQELLTGKLDAKNFIASDLKSNVAVQEGAYFTPHYTEVEVPVFLGGAQNTQTKSMNFVQSDGATLRSFGAASGAPSTEDIFVIPNTQAWVSVTNNAGAPLKTTITTDQAVLWITAYVQYVWNGFFEPKGGPSVVDDVYTGSGNYGQDPTDFLNADGSQRAPYAYRLREITPEFENKYPDRGGFHHLSRGERPANVQFALRVDGRIIEESITGKQGTYDHEPKGIRAGQSSERRAAQRSFEYKVTYDNALPRPGQRVPSERAVGLGPEVLPVRFGCTVPVAPGTHDIEIIARRLRPLQDQELKVGDYVGVFSRRLLTMELPAYSSRATDRITPPTIPSFESETGITQTRIGTNITQKLQNRLNDIRVADVARNSLPNTHLPSKVKYSNRALITPTITDNQVSTGLSRARWPGWGSYKNRVVSGSSDGWGETFVDATGAGWFMLTDGLSGDDLEIAPSGANAGKLNVASNEFLITMADVNLRRIAPIKSDFVSDIDPAGPSDKPWRDYLGYYMPHKYLDFFAAFSIGYYDGANWNIVDAHRPSWVNRYNWIHRMSGYRSADAVLGDKVLGAGSSGFPSTEGVVRIDAVTDGRGGHTEDGLQSVNVPLFWAIDGADGAKTIEKVAVFVTSAVPGWWRNNFDHGTEERMWEYPHRDIVKGLQVHWGNSHLSAIKVEK